MAGRFRRGDIDATYSALRPRLGTLGTVSYTPSTTIPAHTHSADQIGMSAAGNLDADDVQEGLEELDSEKLARDGSQTMLGDLDMNTHDINNIVDADIEGNATVGVDIIMTAGTGAAKLTDVRLIDMAGDDADGEARIKDISALLFSYVTPSSTEIGRMHFDSVEDTVVVYIDSGAA
jgi:hypothetical protein